MADISPRSRRRFRPQVARETLKDWLPLGPGSDACLSPEEAFQAGVPMGQPRLTCSPFQNKTVKCHPGPIGHDEAFGLVFLRRGQVFTMRKPEVPGRRHFQTTFCDQSSPIEVLPPPRLIPSLENKLCNRVLRLRKPCRYVFSVYF